MIRLPLLLFTFLMPPLVSGVSTLSERIDGSYARRFQAPPHKELKPAQKLNERQLQITGDFDDNTQGYCLPDYGLNELAYTELLFNSHTEEVDSFLTADDNDGDEVAIDELQDFVFLTKVYLPSQSFTDREILLSIMFPQAEGPDRFISSECADAIKGAVSKSLRYFYLLMNIGQSFDFDDEGLMSKVDEMMQQRQVMGEDEDRHGPIDVRLAQSWVLAQMEEIDASIFERYIRTLFGYFEAFGDFQFFNQAWLNGVDSWEELSLTPVSIVSKYAATYLTDGEPLKDEFNEQGLGEAFESLFQETIDICNPPTEQPSASPSLGPDSRNRLLPVVVIATDTDASAQEIADSYASFRSNYPERIFCLLQVREFDGEDLWVPREFALDPLVRYKRISYDYNDVFLQSDWFNLCGLDDFTGTTITTFPHLVNFNETLVEASLRFYKGMVDSIGGQIVEVSLAPNRNWIEPLDDDFGGGGPRPGTSPSLSPVPDPTPPPTEPPTAAPVPDPTPPPTATTAPPTVAPIPDPTPPPTVPAPTPPPTVTTAPPTVAPIPDPTPPTTVPAPTPPPTVATAPPTTAPTTVLPTTAPPTTASSTAPSATTPDASFTIDIDFVGASVSDKVIISRARERMESIITGDIADASIDEPIATPCGAGRTFVDDHYVCLRVRDLPNNILGVGGVRLVRTSSPGNLLPVTGEISIDRNSHIGRPGRLRDTVEHELLHALGFGILFDVSPYTLAGPGTGSCSYSGNSEAGARFQSISECPTGTSIPMTRTCGHWSEECFSQSEKMGPYGGSSLSELTIAALQDLGYEVDFSQADSLNPNLLDSSCRCGRRNLKREEGESKARLHRLLNDANRQFAVDYGLSLLTAREMEMEQNLMAPMAGYKDIGNEKISIMYLDEEGNPQGIIVDSNMSQ